MKSDQEILQLIREAEGQYQYPLDQERVLRVLKDELHRDSYLDPLAPPLSRTLRARLYLREKKIGTLPAFLCVIAGALLVTALVTQADTAVARWVASVLQTGEPGGAPTMVAPVPDPELADQMANSAVVLAAGTLTPTSKLKVELAALTIPNGSHCLRLDIPSRTFGIATCTPPNQERSSSAPTIKAMALGRPAGLSGVILFGTAPTGTTQVKIRPYGRFHAGRELPPPGQSLQAKATLFDPPAEIRARAGLPTTNASATSKFFVAHWPSPIPPRLVAIALGRDGKPLATGTPVTTTDLTAASAPGTTDQPVAADPP